MAFNRITYELYNDWIDRRNHILVAGMTGSGKSVIINGMINSILYKSTDKHCMILIDPKRVELSRYKKMPHCLLFATEMLDIERALRTCLNLIDNRFKEMEERGETFYSGPRVHIFIDEMADLMLTSKTSADAIQRIAQIGRAANIQLICATQCPLASVIPTRIQVNFGMIVGLHTRNAQDSRNILGTSGCEQLPQYGEALVQYADKTDLQNIKIPMVTDSELRGIIQYRLEEIKDEEEEKPIITTNTLTRIQEEPVKADRQILKDVIGKKDIREAIYARYGIRY